MEFNANLSVAISKQGSRFIAYSPALDISTSGATETKAKSRFVELVHLFVEELEAAGTTAEVLRELGWKKEGAKKPSWMPPVYKTEKVAVRVPIAA